MDYRVGDCVELTPQAIADWTSCFSNIQPPSYGIVERKVQGIHDLYVVQWYAASDYAALSLTGDFFVSAEHMKLSALNLMEEPPCTSPTAT